MHEKTIAVQRLFKATQFRVRTAASLRHDARGNLLSLHELLNATLISRCHLEKQEDNVSSVVWSLNATADAL